MDPSCCSAKSSKSEPISLNNKSSSSSSHQHHHHSSTLRSNASSAFYYTGGQRRRSRPFTYGFGVGGGRKNKELQTWLRCLTVCAYFCIVSMPGLLLSYYYTRIWDPTYVNQLVQQPHLSLSTAIRPFGNTTVPAPPTNKATRAQKTAAAPTREKGLLDKLVKTSMKRHWTTSDYD